MPQKSSGTGGRGSLIPTPPKAPESLLTGKKKKTTPSGFTQPVGSAIPYAGGTSAGKASSTAADPKKQGGRTSGGGGVSAGSVSNTAINGTGGGGVPGMFAGGVNSPGYAGGGIPGATGGVTDFGSPGTGYAAPYTPGAIMAGLDPSYLAADILAGMGIDNMDLISGLAGTAGKDNAIGLLLDFLLGGDVSGRSGNVSDDITNTTGNWLQNMITPGGTMPNANELMDIILNAPPDSDLGVFLASATPQDVQDMIMSVMEMSMGASPYYSQIVGGQFERDAFNASHAAAKGDLNQVADGAGYLNNLRKNPFFSGYF